MSIARILVSMIFMISAFIGCSFSIARDIGKLSEIIVEIGKTVHNDLEDLAKHASYEEELGDAHKELCERIAQLRRYSAYLEHDDKQDIRRVIARFTAVTFKKLLAQAYHALDFYELVLKHGKEAHTIAAELGPKGERGDSGTPFFETDQEKKGYKEKMHARLKELLGYLDQVCREEPGDRSFNHFRGLIESLYSINSNVLE